MLVATLLVVSLAILIVSLYLWRETSSRPGLLNGLFCSATLLISARLTAEAKQPEMAVGLPLLAGMLLLGRGAGLLIRSRREPSLRFYAILWLAAATVTLACTAAVYVTFTR